MNMYYPQRHIACYSGKLGCSGNQWSVYVCNVMGEGGKSGFADSPANVTL